MDASVLMEFLERPDPQARLAQRVLPVLQVKMAQLDLQGLQVQLALRVLQVQLDLQVLLDLQAQLAPQGRKVPQDETGKMQLFTQLNQTWDLFQEQLALVIKI
jgi:hypothetical protein